MASRPGGMQEDIDDQASNRGSDTNDAAVLIADQGSLASTDADTDELYDANDADSDTTLNEDLLLERLLADHSALIDDGDEEEDDDEYENGDDEEVESYETISDNGIEVSLEPEANEDGDESEPERTLRRRRYLLQLLQNSNLRDVLYHFTVQDNAETDEHENPRWLRTRRRRLDPNRFPKVPSDEGRELMNSGLFGSNEAQVVSSGARNTIGNRKKIARRILDRELATGIHAKQKVNQRLMAQGMIPSSNADMIVHYDEPVYSGQFSDDGNFFFSANKDYKVRMYDTSNPYKWRYYKTVEYPFGQWTLTDASLSPDNKYLAYTSIRSQVCLAPTDPNDMGDPYVLDLASTNRNGRDPHSLFQSRRGGSFGIWSIRFSGDGRELVAGATGGSIVVYDIESRQTLHRIAGHDEDVNAVCFADKSSPHILYSGSDDTTLKVWDTRSMGDTRAAGAFIGHIEGITYIDSKGDGRYVLSNGKDQSMKLWDLRMVMPARDYENIRPTRRVTNEGRFDYRWGSYNEDEWYKDPHDNSVVTFRGHKVLRTLIRCHFSPPGSTNSRYVYSGSEDGKVYIYNMDATLAGTIDVFAATRNSRPQDMHYDMMPWNNERGTHWKACVRDASWHPSAPMIVASAFNGYGSETGTCTLHSWNDGAESDEAEPKMGHRVNGNLEYDEQLYHRGSPSHQPIGRAARLRALRRQQLLDDSD